MPRLFHKQQQRRSGGRRYRYGTLRQFVEFLVCLLVTVSLCRTFAVESYMIETGSMAPALYGRHRRVTCPSCRFQFAVGANEGHADREAVCPNCHRRGIGLPTHQQAAHRSAHVIGDRVLVIKDRFANRRPRRWEIAVFRNPNRSTENYVKRIVGLPGERIQIQNGDIHINGKIQRKTLRQQRQMRIPVFDNDFRPPESDLHWQPHWKPANPDNHWKAEQGSFAFTPAGSVDTDRDIDWTAYRHWIRGGSMQTTAVPLPDWPQGVKHPDPYLCNVKYHREKQTLACHGVMTIATRNRLSALSSDFVFQRALEQLFEKSHIGQITDRYGYNASSREIPVRDLQLALFLKYLGGDGDFVVRMSDGIETIECRLDFQRRMIQLTASPAAGVIFEQPLPERILNGGGLLEISLMDRQALVAFDGKIVGQAWTYPAKAAPQPVPLCPVQFGAKDVQVRVKSLKLFRDIHYLSKSHEAGFRAYQLGADEYFALGDNSPISEDSRVWLTKASPGKLTQKHFIGKPFLVHLPSKTWRGAISIPDVSRIRYIR